MKKLDELGEDFCCPICDDLLFQAVTLMPCLHNFCGSCFSDWMVKQKTCPSCREDVGSVKQNATINSVIEKFLTANPQRKRPEAEYKMMEENNKIR
jgi:E3 ubiquitin-protein ligase CHFR